MKKIILAFLLLPASIFAQTKFVTTPTVAYNDSKGSKAVGIFLRGAQLKSYEWLKDEYVYKINNKITGTVYITDSYNVNDALNSSDEVAKSPAVVIDSDEYYGSPHLFTTVAGLKVREQPNSESAVIGKLLNGTPVPIYYYPYNTEAWIPVNVDNKLGFIPLKYTGKRPDFTVLKNEYQKATSLEEQKKWIERLLELGWNSDRLENAEALKLFSQFAKNNNQPEVAELAFLQAEALGNAHQEQLKSNVDQLIEKKQFGFTINEQLEPKNGFKKAFLETYVGKIKDQYTNLDDCALGDYESNVFFPTVECIGHDVTKTYQIRSMDMVGNNGFRIKNKLLNAATTESEFLKSSKGLITFIHPETHSYFINHEDMNYVFEFKNNLLIKVTAQYYC